MKTDKFWVNPPWRGGRTPFRLGLVPITEAEWLPEPICSNEYRRKLMLLSGQREAVLAEVPGHAVTVERVALGLRTQLQALGNPGVARARDSAEGPEPHPGLDRSVIAVDEPHPLARAALMVPDDLCVLVPEAAGWVLAGACLCSPSFWRLGEKIGRPMSAIHGPVAGLEASLGARIARFLDHLPVGKVFERRNWNVHRDTARFHPQPEDWDPPPDAPACANLFVRSERQTFRKFEAGALLFTIGVEVHPLAEIRAHPAAVADLLTAIAAMTPEERASFGYRHHGEALVAWLRTLA
jgi:dimethylamine monooxygenase subunit A